MEQNELVSVSSKIKIVKEFNFYAPRPLSFDPNPDISGFIWNSDLEDLYAIRWETKSPDFFELPTGGSSLMREGTNVLYFPRKEQCLALGTQLRTFKINNYYIVRILPSGVVQYLHPFDGVFPEKVNEGRIQENFGGQFDNKI
tara:strand:- start:2668 stop:3096 length:429 start_codon:yes stop_codon:yes gene_type:complete